MRIRHETEILALSLLHSKQWEACWRYVMGVVDLTVVPTGHSSSPRRINRYLRAQLLEEMVVLHQAGQTVAQIATRFGFHRTTVAKHLKQAGEKLRTNPADSAFQEQVRQVYAELGTVKHTAQRLGVSKDAVRKVVRGE